jgi:hypothetical protein
MKDCLKRVGPPRLLVECENLVTLCAVAKVVNESGLNARVLLEYELGEKNEKSDSNGLGCDSN